MSESKDDTLTFFTPLREEIDEGSKNDQSSLLVGLFNKFFKTNTQENSTSNSGKINNSTTSSFTDNSGNDINNKKDSLTNVSIADDAIEVFVTDKNLEIKKDQLKKYDQSEFKRYWVPDSTGIECYECHEKFNAFRRKHHCRICGQIFCAKCTNNTVDGAVLGYREFLRVCNYCKKNIKSNDKYFQKNGYDSDDECILKCNDNKTFTPINDKKVNEISRKISESAFEPVNNVNSVSMNFPLFKRNNDEIQNVTNFNTSNEVTSFQPTNIACEKQLPTFLNIDDLAKNSIETDFTNSVVVSSNFKNLQRKEESSSSTSDNNEPEWVRNIELSNSGSNIESKTSSDNNLNTCNEQKLFNTWNVLNSSNDLNERNNLSSENDIPFNLKDAFDKKLNEFLDVLLEKEQIDKQKWKTLLLNLSKEVSETVEVDVRNKGDNMNPLKYVHIKKFCCDISKPSAKLINGIVCSKSIAHANMASKIYNGSVLMLSGSIEYERVTDKLSFIDHILQQERGYLSNQVDRIVSRLPSILIVENSVANVALDMLLDNNICLIHNIKPKIMKRIARIVGSDVLPAFDAQILNQRIGYVYHFSQERVLLRDGKVKTILVFKQDSGVNGVSVLLKASSTRELKSAKRILKLIILARYSSKLEIALLEMFNTNSAVFSSSTLPAKCLTCQLNSMDLDYNSQNDFLHEVNNCHLGWSPFISVGPPYMETKRGQSSAIRQYFRDNLFSIGKINDYKILAEDEDKKENDLFECKKQFKILEEDIENEFQHFFVKEKCLLIEDVDDNMSLYRALSGKIFKDRCKKKRIMEKELMEKQVHLADDANSPLRILQKNDVFNPENHQRISYLFGSFTKKSSNPFFCVLPYVLKMEFYSQHDMCLGMFLSKFCFNDDYKCYDQNCSVPMIDHQRKIVHRKVRIEIISQKYVQSIEDMNLSKTTPSAFNQENVILCWQHCPTCIVSSAATPLSHEVWHLSFAKYIEYLANSINCVNLPTSSTTKNLCNHCSFHDHQHFFAYNDYVTSFKVYPIKPFHVQFSPIICLIEPRFVSISGLELEYRKVDSLAKDLFEKISENLAKLKVHPSGIRFQLVHDTLKAFLDKTELDVNEALQRVGSNNIFKSNDPVLSNNCDVLKINDLLNWSNHKLYELTILWNDEVAKINFQTKLTKKSSSSLNTSTEENTIIPTLSNSSLSIIPTDTNTQLELQTIYDPFPENLHLSLPQVKDNVCIIVKDLVNKKDSVKPDYGSIIAYTLASNEYKEERKKLRYIKNCMDTPLNLKISELQNKDEVLSKNTEVQYQKNHIDITFEDSNTSYFVNVYYAEHFQMLRKICFVEGEDMFIRSLSSTTMWKPQGGKSGSDFYRTDDKRFVFKEMAKPEIDFFLTFAPKYFDYIYTSITEKKITCLGKIYGVYRVCYKNKKTNSQCKMDILVMEYLFYKKNIKQYWDLKGSLRNRKAYPEKHHKKDQVLLDENFVNNLWNNQFYVHPHAKAALTQAIDNDSKFLSAQKIMDYSLLVGVDSENDEVILGIVDYMRPYTIEKQIESAVKKAALPGNQLPTIINPEDYRVRFMEAINNHYIHVAPDQWTGLASISVSLESIMNNKRKRTKEDEDKEANELAQQLKIVNDEHSNFKKSKITFLKAGTINGDSEKSSNLREYITIADDSSSEVNCTSNDNNDNLKDRYKSRDKKQNSYIEIMNENNGFREGPMSSTNSSGTHISKAIAISRNNSKKPISDELTTTNLYVQGLPDRIHQNEIKETFGSYGPLVQIKILDPPRNQVKNVKRCAFVQFASRKDAERALLGMNNELFDNSPIKISFANAQPYSSIIYRPRPLELYMYRCEQKMPFSANPLPNAEKKFKEFGNRLLTPLELSFNSEFYENKVKKLALSSVVPVCEPSNKLHKKLIDQFVVDCIENKNNIESFIAQMKKLVDDLPYNDEHRPFFLNLFTHGTIESNYFIWKAFSIMNGDTFDNWMTNYYRIFKDGPVWIPPNSNIESFNEMPEFLYHTAYNYKEMSSKELRDSGMLLKKDKDDFLSMLSSGNLENSSIINLLHFCGNHANEAKEVVKCIISFLDSSNNYVNILNVWFLISDLIRNYKGNGSSSSKFEKYYVEIIDNIIKIVDRIKLAIDNIEDHKSKQELRKRALNIVTSWQNSDILDRKTLQDISNRLYGIGSDPVNYNSKDIITNSHSKSRTSQARKITASDWKKKYFAEYVKKVSKNVK
uniref:1-phosphatidylinositol-3-phosphate 5-kinase n=1 Tax=Strongyloides stercoralis TaxID=6248 RepID=A0AAF5CZA6_STRER